jgi:hypothetical protein
VAFPIRWRSTGVLGAMAEDWGGVAWFPQYAQGPVYARGVGGRAGAGRARMGRLTGARDA